MFIKKHYTLHHLYIITIFVCITMISLSVSHCPVPPLLPVPVKLLVALATVQVSPAVCAPHTGIVIADHTPGELLRLRLGLTMTGTPSHIFSWALGRKRGQSLLQPGLRKNLHQDIVSILLTVFLTLVIFWLPPESPAKMILGQCCLPCFLF